MNLELMPLARQMDVAFKEMKEEFMQLTSGTVLFQIRNNVIGKFGIKHLPLESKGGQLVVSGKGLGEVHYQTFRQMAIDSLKYKRNWTHGEIAMDFAIRQDLLSVSIQFESNYNMSNLKSGKAL
ncbi:O-methyltransferase [Paenibacillus hexagrammi]|uniref:O-methyltransferase n=1 Tax=Paenibacillus hexagrammi TaxID=2908839 RepID=A0ABY3SFT9_9BACL|nr:O-methyltransferase [Paenibacillus sp. YPD9-1]UJF32323.1 O-methyltransferase [Paenibacillus sp. YPD9-1]